MFDFENLIVYQRSRQFNKILGNQVISELADRDLKSQLNRASSSIMLNIAEGSGRFTKKDKRHFYIIARGSLLECIATIHRIQDLRGISDDIYNDLYNIAEEISKMLYKMINDLTV